VNEILSAVITGLGVFIAFLVYERTKNKDSSEITTTLAILMTKVDSLIDLNKIVKKHEEMLIRHDEEIKYLKDTSRFAKITDEMLKGSREND
jgi:Ni/Fe-hydrogenase subunit HybB-like protein